MNEETPGQPDTRELSLDQLRLLGDLLSCLDAAGFAPKDTQQLQLILAAHLRPQAGSPLPGSAEGDQALRPEPDDALLDSLDTAALIARSSLGTPSARRIRSLTSTAQIAEILRRRDQITTAGQQPPADVARTGVTETVPATAFPAEDQQPTADARPRRRARWRFRMPSARNLLITLSGARAAEVAGQDRRERLRRQSLGLAILLTSVIAAVSMWFTLSTVMGANPVMAFLAALTGLFVSGINRWLVTPGSVDGGRRWASVIPRLVIAAVVGVLISTPIVLRVFQPEINTQVAIIKAETGENAARLQAELASLQTVIDSGGKAPLSPSADPQLKSLTKRLEAAQTSERQAYQKWQCEVFGLNCAGSSGAARMGPRAQADAEALHNAQAQVAALTNQIQQRERQLTANTPTAEAARYDTALHALTATQQQAAAAKAQHNKTSNRLWIELRALNQLAGKNLTITIAGLLSLVLFIVLGCLPLAVKLLERPRPGKKLQQAGTKRAQRDATAGLPESLRSAGAEEQVTALAARISGQRRKRIKPSVSQDFEGFLRASYTQLLARALYMGARKGATKEEAEDALQSAMINLLDRWEEIRDPREYAYRVIAHVLIKQKADDQSRYDRPRLIGEVDPLLTPGEVAAIFRVDPKAVTRWAKAGRLTSIRTSGGRRRYRESEVLRLLQEDSREAASIRSSRHMEGAATPAAVKRDTADEAAASSRTTWWAAGIGILSLGIPVVIGVIQPILGALVAAIEMTAALTTIGMALFGSQALSERAFRFLRWIRNRPEPASPAASFPGEHGHTQASSPPSASPPPAVRP